MLGITKSFFITVATLLQAHPTRWAFECIGPSVSLEFEPTRGGLIIQCGRYPYKNGLDFDFISKSTCCKVRSSIKAMAFINDIGF